MSGTAQAALRGLEGGLRAAGMYDMHGTTLVLRWGSAAVLALLLGGGYLSRRGQDTRRRYWPQVRGRVVAERDAGYIAGGDRSGYDKIVSFRTRDGHEVTGVPRNGSYLGLPVIGREVPVWYDPRDANRFEAQVHALDRSGTPFFLAAVVPAILLIASLLP